MQAATRVKRDSAGVGSRGWRYAARGSRAALGGKHFLFDALYGGNADIALRRNLSDAGAGAQMYMDDGKMKGSYTTCAILKKEPRAEADAMMKQYGLTCGL